MDTYIGTRNESLRFPRKAIQLTLLSFSLHLLIYHPHHLKNSSFANITHLGCLCIWSSYEFLLCLSPLTIRVVIIKLISAIAQNEAKLKIPMKISFFHSMPCSKFIERGTIIPTRTDKTSIVLKDPKGPFPLYTLFLTFYFVLTWTALIF